MYIDAQNDAADLSLPLTINILQVYLYIQHPVF